MDFMFEDEVDEVGSDVEAYCPKCKADTTHVVISKYEDEIRRVQCNPCGDVHSFRKPRGEVEDDVPEPIAAKKRAMIKKANWDEFFAKHGEKQGKPYEFRERYSENVIVTHPKFGRGFVSEVMSDSKVEITFKDARRVLVHNRKDMPGLPLAAEGDGIPSKSPKAKAMKNKVAKEEKKDDKKDDKRDDRKDEQRDEKKDERPAAKAPPPAPPVAKSRAKSDAGPKEDSASGKKRAVTAKVASSKPGKGDAKAKPAAAKKPAVKPAKAEKPKPAAKVAKGKKAPPAKSAKAGKKSR